MDIIFIILISLVFFKSMVIGSEFDLWHWFQYGKVYYDWYTNRQTFDEYLKTLKGDN